MLYPRRRGQIPARQPPVLSCRTILTAHVRSHGCPQNRPEDFHDGRSGRRLTARMFSQAKSWRNPAIIPRLPPRSCGSVTGVIICRAPENLRPVTRNLLLVESGRHLTRGDRLPQLVRRNRCHRRNCTSPGTPPHANRSPADPTTRNARGIFSKAPAPSLGSCRLPWNPDS